MTNRIEMARDKVKFHLQRVMAPLCFANKVFPYSNTPFILRNFSPYSIAELANKIAVDDLIKVGIYEFIKRDNREDHLSRLSVMSVHEDGIYGCILTEDGISFAICISRYTERSYGVFLPQRIYPLIKVNDPFNIIRTDKEGNLLKPTSWMTRVVKEKHISSVDKIQLKVYNVKEQRMYDLPSIILINDGVPYVYWEVVNLRLKRLRTQQKEKRL